MTSNFAMAAEKLRHVTNAAFGWQLLSISFDPANDTPQRLKTYALAARYDPRHWSFLTGDERQISGLAAQMGEIYRREGTTISHNLHTIVVDPMIAKLGCVVGGQALTATADFHTRSFCPIGGPIWFFSFEGLVVVSPSPGVA